MNFSKLIIKNFRSVGPKGVTITFSNERNLAAIVGANASGKSNVLEALGVVLGMYPFSRFSACETDFHCNQQDGELLIELHLDPPLVDHDVYQREFQIHGFRYKAKRKERNPQRGTMVEEHYCFGENGATLVKPIRMFKKSGQPDDGIENIQRPILVDDQAWKLGQLFYLDPPTLERFFDRTTGYSPLGRLFDIYREDFDGDHNTYSPDKKTTITSREAFERFSQRLATILRTEKLGAIEQGLSKHTADYLGRSGAEALKVQFSLPSHRDLFEKWVSLQVSEANGLPPLPIDRLGSGYRALLRLAVLETLLEFQQRQTSVLLIEEPESYLHVHLRRYFSGVLRGLAEKGHQIVFTTHAPEFVDIARPHEVVRLFRAAGISTEVRQVKDDSKIDFNTVKRKLRRMGNEEIFFARHALLTEGQDDQGILEELLTRRGTSLDVHSVSVVNCDGVEQITSYVQVCSELGIDFYVVHDQDDTGKANIKKRNEKILKAVQAAGQALPALHVFVSTLETAMNTTKTENNLDQLLGLLGEETYQTITQKYPALAAPIEEFVSTRGLAITGSTACPAPAREGG